jgi:DNA-binding transcriptional MerR regulator
MSEHARDEAGSLVSIGVFARRSRLSMKALRLYDRLGLLRPSRVDEANGYRWYREGQLGTARLIAMLRRLDMPLERIAEVLAADGRQAAELVASYWADVERRSASQRELASYLTVRLGGDPTGVFDVRERDVPAQLVLTERRHIRVPELAPWLGRAMCALAEAAAGHGGVSGAPFAIYHGEVDEDGDGPVELCMPVSARGSVAGAYVLRTEPAHREAYTRLAKAQVEYPQILSAFDAVSRWLSTHSHTVAGAPREVYFGDWDAATAAVPVCDVALPIR